MIFRSLSLVFCFLTLLTAGCGQSDRNRAQDLKLLTYDLTDWQKNWRILKPEKGPVDKGSVRFAKFGDPPELVAIFDGSPEIAGVLKSRPLPARAGAAYRFSFELFRPRFQNGHYLSVLFFGEEFYLNNHCVAGGWQKFRLDTFTRAGFSDRLVFRNDTESGFLLRRPALKLVPEDYAALALAGPAPGPKPGGFPLGAYGLRASELAEAAACGLNLAILSAKGPEAPGLLRQASEQKMRLILFCPLEKEKINDLARGLSGVAADLRPAFFYLQDEPEIRSTPLENLLEARGALKEALPWARTATAMVRPWLVPQYGPAYDAIFMDQYPVPQQPLNWLADSIRQARRLVPPGREVWAVIQAFGGGRFADLGWPRLPTAAEMGALAGEALAEGAQGILFYTWDLVRKDPGHRQNVCNLATRLKLLEGWLPLVPGLPPGVDLKILGRVTTDAGGSPAVRIGWRKMRQGTLILAANPTPYPVRLQLAGLRPLGGRIKDLWSGRNKAVLAGEIREALEPYGVRAWRFDRTD